MLHRLVLGFSLLWLAACSSPPPASQEPNTQSSYVDVPQSAPGSRIRLRLPDWSSTSRRVAEQGGLPRDVLAQLLDDIQALATELTPSCKLLDLKSVVKLPLQRVVVPNPHVKESTLEFVPQHHHQLWSIDACGVSQRWRVLDHDGFLRTLVYH